MTIFQYPLMKWGSVVALTVLLVVGYHTRIFPFLSSQPALAYLEMFGSVFAFVSVLLVIEERIWNFPAGIMGNLLLGAVFYTHQLYGSMIVQGVYLLLTAYGWWVWSRRGPDQSPLRVNRMPMLEKALLPLIMLPAAATFGWYLLGIGSSLPFLDAGANVISLSAQYLISHKRIEIWGVGIVADTLYIILYILQGLWLVAALYAVFLVMCILGWIAWARVLRAQQTPRATLPVLP